MKGCLVGAALALGVVVFWAVVILTVVWLTR
jgi:hypothetical protein